MLQSDYEEWTYTVYNSVLWFATSFILHYILAEKFVNTIENYNFI